MTNQEAINRALQKIFIIESGESANNDDSTTALNDLNSMMAEWKVADKDLGWFSQDDLTATFPVPGWAENAVIANLAVRCASTFHSPVDAVLTQEAMDGESAVIRTMVNLTLEGADMSHIPLGERGRWNIETDR